MNVWILTKKRINVLQKEELVHKTWAWTNMGHWLMRTTKYSHMAFSSWGGSYLGPTIALSLWCENMSRCKIFDEDSCNLLMLKLPPFVWMVNFTWIQSNFPVALVSWDGSLPKAFPFYTADVKCSFHLMDKISNTLWVEMNKIFKS